MDTWRVLVDVLAPVLVFIAVAGGWFVGRKKSNAETDNVHVESLAEALAALRTEMKEVRADLDKARSEVDKLKVVNQELVQKLEGCMQTMKDNFNA